MWENFICSLILYNNSTSPVLHVFHFIKHFTIFFLLEQIYLEQNPDGRGRHVLWWVPTDPRTPPVCTQAQSCPTLWDPVDCSPPGSPVHGISQARILEWVAISFSRGSSWPRDWTCVSCLSCSGRQILHHWDTWEAHCQGSPYSFFKCEQVIRWVFFNLTHLTTIYLKVIDTLPSVSPSG